MNEKDTVLHSHQRGAYESVPATALVMMSECHKRAAKRFNPAAVEDSPGLLVESFDSTQPIE